MAGGVTGVTAGNRTSYAPRTPGRSSISMGRGAALGSMSSGSGSVSVGLILTLRMTPCPQTPENTSSKGLQRPVWEATSEEKVAVTCASKGLQRPVWLDPEQSKIRHKELQRPVGTWSQNKVFIPLDRNKDTQLLQVMKHVPFISKQIEPN